MTTKRKSLNNKLDKRILFSDTDKSLVEGFSWWITSHGYVIGYKRGFGKVYMHRLVAGAPKGLEVDHKNGDKLDNRRENLRTCTRSENMLNVAKFKNNKSGFKGVSWNKSTSSWVARISVNGKYVVLGYFDDIKSAATAYRKAGEKHHGDFYHA